MFSQKVLDVMNDQIRREFESAHIYFSMAAYFDSTNLPGFAHWMKIQFQEEQNHAFKFYNFINDRGSQVKLQALGKPPVEFQSPLDVFQKALAHEEKMTGYLNDLYALTMEEKDFASQILVQWFVEEQVEEEKNAGDVVEMLLKIGDNYHALMMLDRELGQRQPPVDTGNEETA